MQSMTSDQVLMQICRNHKLQHVNLVWHTVKENWRQINPTTESQVRQLDGGLLHDKPISEYDVLAGDLSEHLAGADSSPSEVISVSSRCSDGKGSHLALMNFHPAPGLSFSKLLGAIELITAGRTGWLLNSGRYYHYYGDYLLPSDGLGRWIGDFLAAGTVLISPCYAAHRLHHGYLTLRLTTCLLKPHVPVVVARFGKPRED